MKNPVFFLVLLWGHLQLGAQCLTLTNCPPAPQKVCDSSFNNVQFWYEPTWYDAITGSHDLAEAAVDLSLSITDDCAGDLQISYVLFLDMEGDGTRETAIPSAALPGSNAVYYGNAANPNYTGGELRHFDERPVLPTQLYGFVLEKTVQGSTTTARVRWASTADPNTYVSPQLPSGNHRIEWRVEQNGEVKTCAYNFLVEDCAAPTIGCLNGLSVNIMPTMMIQLWATDFLQSAGDNITPVQQLVYGIRRAGAGTGFPLDANGQTASGILFTCADLGSQPVELWTKDAVGNASFCTSSVLVQDNNGNCNGNLGPYSVCAVYPCSTLALEDLEFVISGSNPALPPFSFFTSGNGSGCANFFLPPLATDVKISPYSPGNPLNAGLSTYDLVLLAKHIDGTQPFTHPEQWVAADTDLNGIIDSNDLRHCKWLLLGEQDSVAYPGFRFYPLNFAFPAGNPLALPIPDAIQLDSIDLSQPVRFAAVKTCDLNCNGLTGIEESPAFGGIGQPQPNPTGTGVSIPLSLSGSVDVNAVLLDLTGRVLYRSTVRCGSGEQQMDIPASAFPQAGLYFWRLQAGETSGAGKIIRQ